MLHLCHYAVIAALVIACLPSSTEARSRGLCDGFHSCRCGVTAARRAGLPLNYKGYNLKMASEYKRAFPRTAFRAGVFGVKPHHVLTVVGGDTCSKATVYDDAGTYQRNVCGMVFLDPNGNNAASVRVPAIY